MTSLYFFLAAHLDPIESVFAFYAVIFVAIALILYGIEAMFNTLFGGRP